MALRLIVASLALLVATVALERRVWTLPDARETSASETRSRIPPAMRRLATFGYSKVLADFLWLDAVQYYGSRANAAVQYGGLAARLEDVTDLDPGFEYAYQFAGQSVPYHDDASHLWYNTNAAIKLLEKGNATGPTRWKIPWLLGFNLYTFRGDYVGAGRAMEQASKLPGAPAYLAAFAGRLMAQGADVNTAIFFTQEALLGAQDERSRSNLESRLKSLILQRDLDVLNAAAQERSKTAPVMNLSDLVGIGGVSSVPPDPFGGSYELDARTGKVSSRHESKILHLYVHPDTPAIERSAN
jgi:hypothetical protein